MLDSARDKGFYKYFLIKGKSYALGWKLSVERTIENFLTAAGRGVKSAQLRTTEQSESTTLLIG